MAKAKQKNVNTLLTDKKMRDGIKNLMGQGYEHPWAVVHRPTNQVIACASRAEARGHWVRLKGQKSAAEDTDTQGKPVSPRVRAEDRETAGV